MHRFEEFGVVGGIALGASITDSRISCAVNARSTANRINFKTRVIGKTSTTRRPGIANGLEPGVSFKGRCIFDRLGWRFVQHIESDGLDADVAKDGCDFFEFVWIGGCEQHLHGHQWSTQLFGTSP